MFVPSQTLHGNGDENQVKAEYLIPEQEYSYSTATSPLQRLKHFTKVVLKIKTTVQSFHLTGDRKITVQLYGSASKTNSTLEALMKSSL